MEKAKIISKNQIKIIDYDESLRRLQDEKQQKSQLLEDEARSIAIESYFASELAKLEEYKEIRLTSPETESSLDSAIPYYEEEDGVIIQKWEIIENAPFMVESEIQRLKQELAADDYKITKCYEASLLKTEVPYNIYELHIRRQALRDKINELELLLTPLE